MKIAIQGHLTRGKEVIQILESLGGKNTEKLEGTYKTFYYIDNKGEIGDDHRDNFPPTYKLYTLDEFEKEFPFKVGDKITIIGLPDFPKVITQMVWHCDEILYSFEGLNNTWFGAKALKKFEMKEERNITLTIDKAKEWYKKGGELKEIVLQVYSEEELNKVELPKTWEEFCKNYPKCSGETFINIGSHIWQYSTKNTRLPDIDKNICPSKESAEAHLALIQLEQLRDCWRQGWEPIWDCSEKWCIGLWGNEISIGIITNASKFLTFPTREMAKEFLECFRDLIEKARNLI